MFRTKAVRRGTRAAAIALAGALALSSCGSDLHPGTAASVDGTNISQDTVDDLVQAACTYIGIQNESGDNPVPTTVSDLRAIVVGALVAFNLIGSATDGLGLTVRDSDVENVASQTPLPAELDADDAALLKEFFYDSAEAQLGQATIGAHLDDDTVTTSEGVSEDSIASSNDYVSAYLKKADVSINPAYGTWSGTDVTAGSGSLSEAVSPDALARAPEDDTGGGAAPTTPDESTDAVPPTQECG